ncbi:MAG: VWA domain-containing protein [Opitutaceae bacterium]|jgi:Ca-activated chloride channel family protein|nr:VWA domain-containing protein [Opitutaceae bacterium]
MKHLPILSPLPFPPFPHFLRLRQLLPLLVLLLPLFPLLPRPAIGASAGGPDSDSDSKTLSPYFRVLGVRTGVEALPLRSTRVDATVAGVIADVRVTQVYTNTGTTPLEAIYVFPGSTRAAVHGLTMTLGDRRLEAEIRERKQARQIYETARSEGKTASLLEQHRPNVFQMNVANILPGDEITVELRYTELLSPEDGVYAFVYPGVVGPRYPGSSATGLAPEDRWAANPYLPKPADGGRVTAADPDAGIAADGNPASTFDIAVTLAAGVPVQEAVCRSHRTKITYDNPSTARIALDPAARADAGNRDFILRYRLAGEALKTGLLIAEGTPGTPGTGGTVGENWFLAMIQPPTRPVAASLPPRDYLFIIDVSGSMRGFPLRTTKTLLRGLFPTMRPQDTFNIVLFSGHSTSLADAPVPATSANIRAAEALVDKQYGYDGTELLPALQHAFSLPRPEATSRTIAIITDGYVTVEHEAFELVRKHLGGEHGANVFAFGIGSSVNRHLIEGLARAGQGEPFIVTDPAEAEAVAARLGKTIASPVLTNINVSFDGFDVYDVEPATLPDVFAERPVILFGKWRGPRTGKITLTGLAGEDAAEGGEGRKERQGEDGNANGSGSRRFTAVLSPGATVPLPRADGLSRLWARHRIAQLGDDVEAGAADREERIAEITRLGLTYRLLTRYTSFVAVDHVVRRDSATTPEQVRQPLPLPRGVENSAVGGDIPTSPEPATWMLMGVAALVLGAAAWRRKQSHTAR